MQSRVILEVQELFRAQQRLTESGYNVKDHHAARAKRIYFRIAMSRLATLSESVRPNRENVQDTILLLCLRGFERNEVVAATAIAIRRMDIIHLEGLETLFTLPHGQRRKIRAQIEQQMGRLRRHIIDEEARVLVQRFTGRGVRSYAKLIRTMAADLGNFKPWLQ